MFCLLFSGSKHCNSSISTPFLVKFVILIFQTIPNAEKVDGQWLNHRRQSMYFLIWWYHKVTFLRLFVHKLLGQIISLCEHFNIVFLALMVSRLNYLSLKICSLTIYSCDTRHPKLLFPTSKIFLIRRN